MHVTKPLPVNLAISGEDLLHDFLSAFPSKKVARATFLFSYTPQRVISLIIHELQHQIDANFYTFFHFLSYFEDGKATILIRISWRTIPLEISRPENQGKLPEIASESAHPASLNSSRD